ncbi:hypothetical protein Misp06_04022 [Microbulbifer sp. NBRC 101763]|uniref:hypothetical protein n=1 Tax=Microbulbifer sp. NBRC 101763 TaxID=1113820 RepID=UPI0030A2DF7E
MEEVCLKSFEEVLKGIIPGSNVQVTTKNGERYSGKFLEVKDMIIILNEPNSFIPLCEVSAVQAFIT